MNIFESLINKLAENDEGVKTYFKATSEVFHAITQPIDTGASALLNSYNETSYPNYSISSS